MAKTGDAARITYRIGADGEIHVRRVGGLSGKKEPHKMAKKPRARWRIGVDGMPYRPLGDRTRKGQKRATSLQRAACVEGAMSALSKGYEGARSPSATCGPAVKGPRRTGARASRAGRLLALWRHGSMGEYATVARGTKKKGKKRRKNPGAPGTVDFVWQPNEGPGPNPCEWAVVEPHSETVLKSGTAKTPKAAHGAAEKVSREFVTNPGKFVRAIEEADDEWTLVPKGRRKKAKKKATKNPDRLSLFQRNLKKGDRVWWSDPGEDLASGVYTVDEVYDEDGERFSDTMVMLSNEAGSVAEVNLDELCAVSTGWKTVTTRARARREVERTAAGGIRAGKKRAGR